MLIESNRVQFAFVCYIVQKTFCRINKGRRALCFFVVQRWDFLCVTKYVWLSRIITYNKYSVTKIHLIIYVNLILVE